MFLDSRGVCPVSGARLLRPSRRLACCAFGCRLFFFAGTRICQNVWKQLATDGHSQCCRRCIRNDVSASSRGKQGALSSNFWAFTHHGHPGPFARFEAVYARLPRQGVCRQADRVRRVFLVAQRSVFVRSPCGYRPDPMARAGKTGAVRPVLPQQGAFSRSFRDSSPVGVLERTFCDFAGSLLNFPHPPLRAADAHDAFARRGSNSRV